MVKKQICLLTQSYCLRLFFTQTSLKDYSRTKAVSSSEQDVQGYRCTGEFPPILSFLEARVRLPFSPCFPEETGPVECLPEHGVRHPEKNLHGRSGDWVIILTSSSMSTLIWVNQPYPGLRPQQLTQKIHVSSVLEFIRLGIPGY